MMASPRHTLTATYLINLPHELRLQREKKDALEYSLTIDDFEVTIRIVNDPRPLVQSPGELAITLARQIEVRVSRDDEEQPPAIQIIRTGGRDLGDRSDWIGARERDYAN